MINKIIDGISIKLNQVFGDGVRIYSEDVKQGLNEPCFFIAVLNPSQVNMIGKRSFRQHPFDVHYFPAVQDNNNEIQSMASDLYDALESITLIDGDLVRGSKMNHESIDGVLHFFVNFDMFVNKVVVPGDPMETLSVNNNVKG
jgi:hypothetical protein